MQIRIEQEEYTNDPTHQNNNNVIPTRYCDEIAQWVHLFKDGTQLKVQLYIPTNGTIPTKNH